MVTLHDQEQRETHEMQDAERRYYHWSASYGKSCRAALKRCADREAAMTGEVKQVEQSSLAELNKALEAHGKTLEALKDVARRLPAGRERWDAIRACLNAGMRKAEVARLLGVSPQRVTQMLGEDDIPF